MSYSDADVSGSGGAVEPWSDSVSAGREVLAGSYLGGGHGHVAVA